MKQLHDLKTYIKFAVQSTLYGVTFFFSKRGVMFTYLEVKIH